MGNTFTLIFAFLLLSLTVTAQEASNNSQEPIVVQNPFMGTYINNNGVHYCGTDQLAHEQFENDPAYRQRYFQQMQEWENFQNGNHPESTWDSSVKYIPVVVHVIHNPGVPIGTGENISLSKVQSQIRILNEDFRKIPGTRGDGNGVDTKYEFFLAQKDPNGNCTDGVVRIESTLTNNHASSQAAQLKALSQWDPQRYYNIWTTASMSPAGLIGYATFPGGNPALDGVVCHHGFFGDEAPLSNPNYINGRAMSHETGHWLNLYHPFQGGCAGMTNGNCNTGGDQVCDTPPVDNPNFQCPGNHNSCNETTTATGGNIPDLVDNYMDYTIDTCKSMFTAGQKVRMDFAANGVRALIWDSTNVANAGYWGCLGITYCNSRSNDSLGAQITNVSFQSVNNSTSACTKYSDHTDLFDDVIRDSTFNFSVTTAACGGGTPSSHQVVAYFDWNRDADFDDPGEKVIVRSHGPGQGTSIVPVTVPGNAPLNRVGIRVICTEDTAVSPCGIYPVGETEDYSVTIRNNPPIVNTFFPSSGQSGTLVTIVGENFEGVNDALFNGVSAFTVNYISPDTITALAPSSSTGKITVISPTGQDESDSVFTYVVQAPVINFIDPDSGMINDVIQIQGGIFSGFDSVLFNNTRVTNFVNQFSVRLDARVPAGATDGKVTVYHPNGNAVSPETFHVIQPLPTINVTAAPGNVCQGEETMVAFNMTGTGPFTLEFTDGNQTYLLPQITSPYTTPFTLNTTTTFTVTFLGDQNHSITNPPGASKTVNVNTSPISDFTYSANALTVTFNNMSSGALNYEWDFGDGSTSVGVNPLHTYTAAGTYDVCLIAETNNGCKDTSCQTISITVGLEDKLVGGSFSAYPNPVNDQLNIEIELPVQGLATVEIIGMDGKSQGIYTINLDGRKTEQAIDMQTLSGGTYVIKLTTPDGQQVAQKIQKN